MFQISQEEYGFIDESEIRINPILFKSCFNQVRIFSAWSTTRQVFGVATECKIHFIQGLHGTP